MTPEFDVPTDDMPKKSSSLQSVVITVVGLAVGIVFGVVLILAPSDKSSAKSGTAGKQSWVQWLGMDSKKSGRRKQFGRYKNSFGDSMEIPKFGNDMSGASMSDFNSL